VTPGRIFAATGNPGKLREFRTLLGDLALEVSSLEGQPRVDFPEEGTDYAVNAIEKARAVAEQLGQWALADDSGLEVSALNGAPGPLSARFGGPDLDDAGRVARLLEALDEVPASDRSARFVCVAALVGPSGERTVARGECSGRILAGVRGAGGFGYDPIFQPDGYEESMAELAGAVKDRISHRGRAFAALRSTLVEALSSAS
jgi:XTP/dITP diphosphohydrolase